MGRFLLVLARHAQIGVDLLRSFVLFFFPTGRCGRLLAVPARPQSLAPLCGFFVRGSDRERGSFAPDEARTVSVISTIPPIRRCASGAGRLLSLAQFYRDVRWCRSILDRPHTHKRHGRRFPAAGVVTERSTHTSARSAWGRFPAAKSPAASPNVPRSRSPPEFAS